MCYWKDLDDCDMLLQDRRCEGAIFLYSTLPWGSLFSTYVITTTYLTVTVWGATREEEEEEDEEEDEEEEDEEEDEEELEPCAERKEIIAQPVVQRFNNTHLCWWKCKMRI